MKNFFMGLISATSGTGPSATRLIYVVNGFAASFCAVLATFGGIIVYCYSGRAEAVYWGGVAALWTATLGFAASTKKSQQNITKSRLEPRHNELSEAVAVS